MNLLDRATRSTPVIGMVADSGLLTRLAVEAGIDFLLCLTAGYFRNQGATGLTPFLPYRNSNDLAEQWLREQVLPRAGKAPVFVGLLASDPTGELAGRARLLPSREQQDSAKLHDDSRDADGSAGASPSQRRLERLKKLDVAGIVNYPSVTLLDGTFRQAFEEEGGTVEAEIEMLRQAKEAGLRALGFVGPDVEAARQFAGAGFDGLILTPGLTREFEDIRERRDRLQQAIRQLHTLLDAVRQVDGKVPCLVFGGPITMPEDLELVFRQLPFDGFVGGSVFGRLPIESSVPAVIRRFKSVTIRHVDPGATGFGPLIGATPAMRQLFRLIERAAAFDLNVCIEGESGVGKELVATQIHRLSRRAPGPLVTLNCGAIPDTLLESELFGHEKGAFTGADRRRPGKFELAHNGTLFLDEIGDLSPRGQVALLRAIQQREIVRVGGDAPVPIDVRILAASNRPLAGLVEQGKFRADLSFRLNNLTLVVPPLRERLEDVPLLVQPILAGLRVQMNRELTDLSPRFYELLRRHAWPGNVRELQHVVAQAALLEDGPVLQGRHFEPQESLPISGTAVVDQVASGVRHSRLAKVRQALREADGNKSKAAAILGVTRKTLYEWLREE